MSENRVETLAFEAHAEFVAAAEALRLRARAFEEEQRRAVDAFNVEQEAKHFAALERFRERLRLPAPVTTH